jgi:DNA transformation protein and related proteins
MRDDGFKDFVLEQLRELEDVDCRSMFGCYGLYLDERFFAILDGADLYFRTDEGTRDKYERLGSGPFQPNERQTLKNYLEVPPDVVEDRERLTQWASEAAAAGSG